MPITELQHVCFEPTCDGCGEGDNFEYGGSFHYPSQAEAIERLESLDWMVRRNTDGSVRSVWCEECWGAKDEVEKADA